MAGMHAPKMQLPDERMEDNMIDENGNFYHKDSDDIFDNSFESRARRQIIYGGHDSLDTIIEWAILALPFALIYAILTHWGN